MKAEDEPINPSKRYVSRLLTLAENDPQIGALMPIPGVRENACKPGLTCDKVIAAFLDGYADRPALGERAYEVIHSKKEGRNERSYKSNFKTITYLELHNKVKALAMAWRKHHFCKVMRKEFVCIMGFASTDYAVIDIACAYAKAVTVPLSSSSAGTDIREILSTIEPVVLASRIQDLSLCVEHAIHHQSIKSIIVFDYDARVDDETEAVKSAKERLKNAGAGTIVHLLDDLIEYGSGYSFSFLPAGRGENEKLSMIIHSSGSTGRPKGACVSARALINTWQGEEEVLPKVTLIMAPFNHNLGRNEMYTALNAGGTAYFTLKQDMSTLFEDIRMVRPTALVFFPRILDCIYQYFDIEVTKRLKSCEEYRADVEAAVKAEMKSTYLGDRLLFGAVASAPVSSKVKHFIAECFDIVLVNGYSTTETASGGLAIDGKVNRRIVLDYKLRDVPELGYFATDKPHPRGEFCVKTQFGITQYYKQPDATAQLFDEEGYSLTGDIVEELGPDQISIIDRRASILKLAQGEYVALGTLGKIFEGESALINQIFLYGNSHRYNILAVVVPNFDIAKDMLNGDATDKQIHNLIRDELYRVWKKNTLKSFEMPRDFIVEKENFSQRNGMLSSVGKYIIQEFKKKYGFALESLYDNIGNNKRYGIDRVQSLDCSVSVRERMLQLVKVNLGIEVSEAEELKTFYELGGDSLAAVLFSLHVEETFGVSIGGDEILSPRNNIRQWVKMVEEAQRCDSGAPTFDFIHGKNAKVIHSKDLRPERFFDTTIVQSSVGVPNPSLSPRKVLLTGANGYLGHSLCLKMLEELSRIDGKLICIVRAQDDAAAKKRLDERFMGVDERMEAHYMDLSKNHLEVLAGDISKPLLGLSVDTFARLAGQTDRICHAGALVNHRLGYRHLFGPNVRGTCEIIHLAISQRIKTIDFISTIGVNNLLKKNNAITENSNLEPNVTLSNKYAAGYIASKWASEHLLYTAHEEYGVLVNIFRCDVIMPDRHYNGQFNQDDFLTRLIFSVMATGLAPKSFYQHSGKGSALRVHFGGIPVDVLSDAIVALNKFSENGYVVFNAANYVQGGVSLDTIVDCIEKEGYKIDRVNSLEEWCVQIERRLKLMPQAQRRRSVVDIIDAFSESFPPVNDLPDFSSFRKLVRFINDGNDMARLSDAYIHDYLQSINLVMPPNRDI